MLNSNHYHTELIGSVEELNISHISESVKPIRNFNKNLSDLADSISKTGLLSPILVRYTDNGKFEVVAGNRRFKACKTLGWKKIQCHIVELDDREAFEASIIENIQRNTLNIIEEGLAYRNYVNDFGWGAASELARKISKSSSYVSKRMRLLELPKDVLQLLCESEISVSTGEELLSVNESDKQSKFAKMALNQSISSKKLRKIMKDQKEFNYDDGFHHSNDQEDNENLVKAFDRSIMSMRITMNRLAMIIEKIEDNWVLYEILMNHKNRIHSEIDLLIREKKKYIDKNHFFYLNFSSIK